MIEEKKFKSYNQQMKHLRDNKKINCKGSNDKYILIRHGYFNIINGYKEPFIAGIDKESKKHKYIKSIDIHDFLAVKEFDRNLRNLLFICLTDLEEELRSIFSYAFDFVNENGKIGWYELRAYNQKDYTSQNIMKLIAKIYSEVNESRSDYLNHYLDSHKYIPTWILTKVLKYATFIEFITYSKKNTIDSFQNLYGVENKKVLLSSLEWMRIVRNSCAHNERVYNIIHKSGKAKSKYIENLLPKSYGKVEYGNLMNLFVYLKYYLPHAEYVEFIQKIKRLLLDLNEDINQHSFDNIRSSMGIKNIEDLDKLLEEPKKIEYNKFDKLLNKNI